MTPTYEPRSRPASLTLNARGEWVPAIPFPVVGWTKQCGCGRRFWRTESYRAHYALRHIVDPEGR